jgi:hypothetical protein
MKKSELRQLIREELSKLNEDKFSDYWDKVFTEIGHRIINYNVNKVTDYNKLVRYLKWAIPSLPYKLNSQIATEYHSYKAGQKSKDDAILNIVKIMEKYRNQSK